MASAERDTERLVWGPLEIDLGGYTVRLSGQAVYLTYKEFSVLTYLAARPNRTVSRRQLLEDVWGSHDLSGSRTVDVHVRRLRSKLEPRGGRIIRTMTGVGYAFVPPEERATTGGAP